MGDFKYALMVEVNSTKLDYNECHPHQSFDNKTPAEVRIVATGDKHKIPGRIEKWDTLFRTVLGRSGTAIS